MPQHDPTRATLWTVSRITEHIGVPRWRVEYIIGSRGILPIDRAGNARVYDPRDVEMIAYELALIDSDRAARTEPREGVDHA